MAKSSWIETAARGARALLAANAVPEFAIPFARALSAFGGYEAAKPSRLRHDWTTQSAGPNTSLAASTTNLVARARDLERNDAHWAKFLQLLADEVVGTGIIPRAVHGRAAEDKAPDSKPKPRTKAQRQADAAWDWMCRWGVASTERRHTLYAMMWLAAMAWGRDGSVFIRRVWDREKGRLVPIRFQLLERDMLDRTKSGLTESGGQVIAGIQVSAEGAVEGYWFYRSHPGESGLAFTVGSVFVPAYDVIHLYMPTRAGQLDGVPFGTASMVRKRDLGTYEAAELTRKETEAMTAIVVTAPPIAEAIGPLETDEEDGTQYGITPTVLNAKGEAVGDLRPGAVLTVENGGSVTSVQPTPTAFYPEYKKANLREIAAGLQTTYEDLSGDLEGVNYTSYRAGHLKRHAYVDGLQWLCFIPTVCDRLWEWTQEAAYLVGTVSTPTMPVEWAPPKRFSVDPEKDAIADIVEVRGGLALQDDKLAARGLDPATFYEKRKAELAKLDASGVVVDSDSRKTSFRGASLAVQGTPLPDESSKTAEKTEKTEE